MNGQAKTNHDTRWRVPQHNNGGPTLWRQLSNNTLQSRAKLEELLLPRSWTTNAKEK